MVSQLPTSEERVPRAFSATAATMNNVAQELKPRKTNNAGIIIPSGKHGPYPVGFPLKSENSSPGGGKAFRSNVPGGTFFLPVASSATSLIEKPICPESQK